jgi:hypothetical protein
MLENLQSELKKISAVNIEQEKTMFAIKKELEKERALSTQKEEYLSSKAT